MHTPLLPRTAFAHAPGPLARAAKRLLAGSLAASAIALTLVATQALAPAFATPLQAQAVSKAVLAGLVTDTAKKGLADVTITVVDTRNGNEIAGRTLFNGRFAIPGLEAGVTYTVKLTKLEYYPVIASSVVIPSTNVLRTEYVMHPNETRRLEQLTVKAKQKGSPLSKKFIDEDEIAKANVHSALDVINKLRPIMLMPSHDICITNDSLALYVDGLRRPLFNADMEGIETSPRIVNQQGNNRGTFYTTVRTNEEIVRQALSEVPAEDIAEITYVSCDDYNPKVLKRNVIWLLTKRYKAARPDEFKDKSNN